MNRLRLGTALALTLLLVQLVLVGSGFTCVSGEDDAHAAMVGMGNMVMGDMPSMEGMPGADADADQAPAPDGPVPTSDPCTLPWAPSGCTLMIPCAPHALTTDVQADAQRRATGNTVVALEIATPPSVVIALDTPPPRA